MSTHYVMFNSDAKDSAASKDSRASRSMFRSGGQTFQMPPRPSVGATRQPTQSTSKAEKK